MTSLSAQIQSFLADPQTVKPLLVILGPTASGKTALSLELAQKFNGEIISTDSRQVYKYMDIGTDKLPVTKQQGITHHLMDIIEPDQEFTLADFKRLANKAIEEIHGRQKLPMLVGGTGLYINSIIENYQIPAVPPDPVLRQKLEEYAKEHGADALHQLLQKRDPEAAAKIHPQNIRYVIRALEINTNGQMRKNDTKGEPPYQVLMIGIQWPRNVLYERINQRVDLQIERGLLNEVKTLLMQGYPENISSMRSLGYQELFPVIRGEMPLQQGIELIKQNTRNYAKRQLTWFRRYHDILWLDGEKLGEVK